MAKKKKTANEVAEQTSPPEKKKPVCLGVKTIALELITCDPTIQMRVAMDDGVIQDYADRMRGGGQFPPLVGFEDGDRCWLADGFHRFRAAELAGLKDFAVEMWVGDRRDAMLHALAANQGHGLRRSHADVRNAIERMLRDEEWVHWSDNYIAKKIGCSHHTVRGHREQLESTWQIAMLTELLGEDGISRPREVRKQSDEEKVQSLKSQGLSVRDIADRTGFGHSKIQRILDKFGGDSGTATGTLPEPEQATDQVDDEPTDEGPEVGEEVEKLDDDSTPTSAAATPGPAKKLTKKQAELAMQKLILTEGTPESKVAIECWGFMPPDEAAKATGLPLDFVQKIYDFQDEMGRPTRPPQKVEPTKEPVPAVDCVGIPIHGDRATEWMAGVEAFKEVRALLRIAASKIDTISRTPIGAELLRHCKAHVRGDKATHRLHHLQTVIETLSYCAPYASSCPVCHSTKPRKGWRKECQVCLGTGFVVRDAWNLLDEAVRTALLAHCKAGTPTLAQDEEEE